MYINRIGVYGFIIVASLAWVNCGSDKVQDASTALPASQGWVDKFHISQKHLVAEGKNPFFILEPGYQLVLRGDENGSTLEMTITVLNETQRVGGFLTRVVEERKTENGRLIRVSRNYVGIDRNAKDVYLFGRSVEQHDSDGTVRTEGSWMSGANGARFGLVIPATPVVGAKFHQEQAPGVAMDWSEIVSLAATVNTPAGTFADCLQTRDATELNRKAPELDKFFAPDIGLVRSGNLLLIKYSR